MSGKGSGRRPGDGYEDGWDRIFKRGKPVPVPPVDKKEDKK